MNYLQKVWLKSAFLFEPVQELFNGNFWAVFIKRFRKYTQGKVIDLGCGAAEFLKVAKPKQYLGIDINEPYVLMNRKKYGRDNIFFEVGDVTKLKTRQKFDHAFLINVAHHLSDSQIKEVCRAVKKMGAKYFIICDGYPNWPFQKFLMWLDSFLGGGDYFRKEDEIEKLVPSYFKILEKGNFKVERSLYTYPYLILRA